MKRFLRRFGRLLMNCGLKNEEYREILPEIIQRNLYTLRSVSWLVIVFGAVFLVANMLTGGSTALPYVVLLIGGAIVLLLRALMPKDSRILVMALCYLQIIAVFVYGIVLSMTPDNHANPATSIVVFLAMLPLAVVDRPLRMMLCTLTFSVIFLVVSHNTKAAPAFRTDAMNIAAFS